MVVGVINVKLLNHQKRIVQGLKWEKESHPATLPGIPQCKDKNFLFLCNPLSKCIDKDNVKNKSTEETSCASGGDQ